MEYIFRVQLDGPTAMGGGGGVLISESGGLGQFIVCPAISITQALVKTAGYGQLLHVIE